jgi:hypothetical protein
MGAAVPEHPVRSLAMLPCAAMHHPGNTWSRARGQVMVGSDGGEMCVRRLHVQCDAKQKEDSEVVKSVLQKGFLGRETENLFPYGIYT